ncbi:MAG: hypothetical protein PF505_05085 [Vallitaleaceae bacterium]|nr:hypothetical protein [Vallitaleaceae bacterium]
MKDKTEPELLEETLKSQLHEAKMVYILEGPITMSLYDTLEKYDSDHLEFMLDEHIDMSQIYTKAELILLLEKELTNPVFLNTLDMVMKEKETIFLQELVEHEVIIDNNYTLSQIDFILDRGLAYAYYIDNQFVYVMPEEIKAAYKRLNTEDVDIEKDTVTYMNQFMEATVNLYGAIPISEVLKIYNHLHEGIGEPLTRDQLDEFLSITYTSLPAYIIIGDILAHEVFEDDDEIERMEAILQLTLPYYMPDVQTYLMYADEFYYEPNEAYTEIENYLRQGWVHSDDEVEEAIVDIIMMLRLEAEDGNEDTLIKHMEDMGLLFASDDALEDFLRMYMAFASSTRMWKNHGYTADGVLELSVKSKRDHLKLL